MRRPRTWGRGCSTCGRFLLCVAFIPFPTRLVAEHVRDEGARAAALTYGITLTVTAVMFQAVWLYAALGRRLLRADADERLVRGITRSYLPAPSSISRPLWSRS